MKLLLPAQGHRHLGLSPSALWECPFCGADVLPQRCHFNGGLYLPSHADPDPPDPVWDKKCPATGSRVALGPSRLLPLGGLGSNRASRGKRVVTS